jgi:thiamine-phosphate pyrophosphorylase
LRNSGGAPGASFPDKRPLFYYITDRCQIPVGALLPRVRRAIAWGVDLVQIREKDLCDRDLFRLTERVLALMRGTACRLLVNGRFDVAWAAGAHGVHLPSRHLRPGLVRSLAPRGFIIGVSAHSLRDARRAEADGADYVLFGPVFPTPSKLSYGPPLGLSALRKACSTVSIPVMALGGLHAGVVEPALRAGCAGIAGIRLFQNDLARLPKGDFAVVGRLDDDSV